MRKIAQLLAAGVVAAAVPMSAQAVVTVTVSATPYDFATPAGLLDINFNSGLPAGVALSGTNYVVQSVSNGLGAAPATGPATVDTTNYLSVYSAGNPAVGGAATLSLIGTGNLYNFISLYWGSMDNYNSIQLLLNGANVENVIAAPPPATGNQSSAPTNARVNISSTTAFNGIRFISSGTAFELDNVGVGAAVPEAATWMMMLAGFGMMGFAMRRRPRTAVTFG